MLGTLVLGGALLSVLLDHNFGSFLPAAVDSLFLLSIILWLVEIGIYIVIGRRLGKGMPLRIALAVGLGLGIRIVTSLLTALLLGAAEHAPGAVITAAGGLGWLYHLCALPSAVGTLLLPCRFLLEPDQLQISDVERRKEAEIPTAFSFEPAKRVVIQPEVRFQRKKQEPAPESCLQPPTGFTPVTAAKDVDGTVSVPASVLLASVPEAADLLDACTTVPVPLALILPQLRRAELWVTWRQLFPEDASNYCDRWLRIPAMHYALQVPREYFVVEQTTPAWLSREPVAQEAELCLPVVERETITVAQPAQ